MSSSKCNANPDTPGLYLETSDNNSDEAASLLNQDTPSNNSVEVLSTPIPETSGNNSDEASPLLNQNTPCSNSVEVLSTPIPEASDNNSDEAASLLGQDRPSKNSIEAPPMQIPETSRASSDEASSLLNQDTPCSNSVEVLSTPIPEASDNNSDEAASLLNQDTPSNNSVEVLSTPIPETSRNNSDEASPLLNQNTPCSNSVEVLSTSIPEASDNNSDEAASLLNQDTPSNNSVEVLCTPIPETSRNNSDEASPLLNQNTPCSNSVEVLSTPIPETSENNSDEASPLLGPDTPGNNSDAITESSAIRDADEVYEKYLREYHPNYMEKVHRVPWTYIGTSPLQDKEYTQNNEKFPHWYLREEYISGDNAEKRVADSLEWLLNTERHAAFILTSYDFRYFCNQNDQPPPGDKNLGARAGEHDIVIIHYEYGIFFIQVKACSEDTRNTQVTKAKRQLSKDVNFFKANFKDFGGRISTFIALPNIEKIPMPRADDGFDGYLPCYSSESGRKEEELRSWWETIKTQCKGFDSPAEYRRVVVKYIGRKSTVKLPMFNSLRSPADVVAGMGNRYMNIALTPQQIYIQDKHLTRLIIRGQHGSGKTVMLILKARQMMAERVCIISMARSPLLQVLDDSVKFDMNALKCNNVSVKQVGDHSELTEILKICAEEKRHVFIDEVPSSLKNDETLKEAINSYPEKCWIWAIMSCERGEDMNESLKEIFSCFDIAVLNKVLRCPPSIFPGCKTVQQPEKSFTLVEPNVKTFFKTHGLELQFPPRASLQWSDFTIVDDVRQQTNIIKWLKKLECPIEESPDLTDYTEEEVKELTGSGQILLINRIHPYYDKSYTRIPIKGGGDFYVARDHGLEKIASRKQLEHFLAKIKEDRQRNLEDKDVILHVKPYAYHFFKELGYPLVTQDHPNLLTNNSILWTTESNFAGYERKMVLRISDNKVLVNQEQQRIEGPKPLTVDHSGHTGPVQECKSCQDQLNGIFGELGLRKISVEDHANRSNSLPEQQSNNANEQRSRNVIEQHEQPSLKLGLCDVVVLDDRQPQHDVINLLNRIRIPPEVSPYGYEDRVVFTTPDMFRGLEKKVVLVITDNDCSDLAVSRCSSQLIVLKTNSDPPGTSVCLDYVSSFAQWVILLLVLCVWLGFPV